MITRRTYVLTAILAIATAALWLFMFLNGYVRTTTVDLPNTAPLHHRTGKITASDAVSGTVTLENDDVFMLGEGVSIYTIIPRELPGLTPRSLRKDLTHEELAEGMIATISYRSLDADVHTEALEVRIDALAGEHPLYPRIFEQNAVAGTIKAADSDNQQITITIDGTDYVFSITDSVVIHRAVIYTENGTQKKLHEEINIEDVSVGDPVMVYAKSPLVAGAESPELYEIYLGSFAYDDAFLASSLAVRAGNPSAPATVENIDHVWGVLSYRTIPPPTATTTAAVLTVQLKDVAIYSVDDRSRAQILHARRPITADEIQPGDALAVISKVMMLPTTPPRGGYQPFELVVIRPQ